MASIAFFYMDCATHFPKQFIFLNSHRLVIAIEKLNHMCRLWCTLSIIVPVGIVFEERQQTHKSYLDDVLVCLPYHRLCL